GDAAPERVLAIGEFKTITETEILHRTFRIYRGTDSENLGLGVCEFWDGSGWSLLAISDEPIAQTYLSTVNLQNVLAVADGFNVFIIKQVSPPEFAVQEAAPAARYLFSFADRLVALQDGLDRQSLAWTVSGDVEDWTGIGS